MAPLKNKCLLTSKRDSYVTRIIQAENFKVVQVATGSHKLTSFSVSGQNHQLHLQSKCLPSKKSLLSPPMGANAELIMASTKFYKSPILRNLTLNRSIKIRSLTKV